MIPLIIDESIDFARILQTQPGKGWTLERYIKGPIDCISATVHEKRNGEYYADIAVPMSSRNFKELKVGGIIALKTPNQNRDVTEVLYSTTIYLSEIQPFRITKISKQMNGVVYIRAEHLTYDLNHRPVADPMLYANSAEALYKIVSGYTPISTNRFFGYSNIKINRAMDARQIPLGSSRQLLGGVDGSFIDTYNAPNTGEFEWSLNTVFWWEQRGENRGVQIVYGKDLLDFTLDEELVFIPTAVMGCAVYNDTESGTYYNEWSLPQEVRPGRELNPVVLFIDFSDKFTKEEYQTSTASDRINKLNELAGAYARQQSEDGQADFNLRIQYADLQEPEKINEIHLCDTIKVIHPKYNFEADAKVIGYDYDALLERYIQIELGKPRIFFENVITKKATQSATNTIKNIYK